MLEQQGQLARRPFMLHDRQNWPQINFTPAGAMHGQAGGMFPGQMHSGMNRNQAQQFYQQSGMMGQGPPSKRLRQTGPAQLPGAAIPGMPPAMSGMPHDPFVEEEESVALGDALDHLTPREISIVRYTQHHEWMEEIFSSAYPAHQIAAVDLGLGLAGELAEITRGILDAPDDKFVIEEAKTRERGYDKAADAKGPEPKELGKSYQRLSTAQQEEFDKRIGAFIEKGEDELEKMRAEHAKTMAELRRGKTYMKAERQLKDALNASRDLPSDDQDGADPIDADPIDAVVKGVENSLAVSVGPRRDVVCVTKGGLVEEEAKPEPEQEQAQEANGTKDEAANGTNDAYNGNGLSNGGMEDTNIGEAAGLLDQFGNSTSFNNTPGANLSTPHLSNPTSHAQSATGTPGVARSDQNQTPGFPDQEGMEAGGEGDAGDGLDLIEGMDLDMPDIPDMSEDAVDEHATGGDDWVMVDDATGGAADQIEDAAVSQANNSAADIPAPIDLPAAEDSAAPGVSDDLPPAAGEAATGLAPQITTASTGADPAPATSNTTPGLYDTGHDFEAEFTHVDSAGDALADFGGGGDGMEDLGLEDSMFGEAIQGLDGADDPDDAGLGDLGAHAEDAALGDMRGVAEDAGDLGAGVIAGAGKEIGVAEGLEETVHPRSAGESGGGAGGTEVAGVTEVGAAAEAGDDAA